MELKNYQSKVIQDLETYLKYIKQYKKTDRSFNQFWEDRVGAFNPLTGEGMQPYKNTIPNAANVCIKVPTAGGKTFIACNALHTVFSAYPVNMPKVVVWLVPWSNLLDQTVAALSNPSHPYRQKLNSLFNHRVEIYQKKDLLQGANFNPSIVQEQLSIFVMSFASLRAKNKEDRKVYQENGQLASFASFLKNHKLPDDTEETSLINVIRNLQPVIVVDESHNAESALSIDMLKALNPSFVLDLTATPKNNSNIISMVPAIELKKEHMVKLPVIVYNHQDRSAVVQSAFHLQRRLELLAIKQENNGGRYIRPIVLFQAQPKTGEENITYEKLKKQLILIGIPENQIKIKTATLDELKGIDLLAKDCQVRFIITINALKEGWDCPFAYILASLADKSSAVDVEQILGRVLRQPYVQKHQDYLLNVSYVLTASAKFNDTLQNIVKGLQASGFSDQDYRGIDAMEPLLNSVSAENHEQPNIEIDFTAKTGNETDQFFLNHQLNDLVQPVINDIEKIAYQQTEVMQAAISKLDTNDNDDHILAEMGDKIKRYRLIEQHKKYTNKLKLPQFYLDIQQNSLFGAGKIKLSQEPLLNQFKLSNEDIKIDFSTSSSDLYKVDLEEVGKDDFDARFSKIEDLMFTEPVVAYIMSKPPERQIKDISHQLMKIIGDMYPIPDQEIRLYLERVLSSLNPEQLQDILTRKDEYSRKIKARIKYHADRYAEERFNDLIKLNKINNEATWTFSEQIVPGNIGAAISKSLYEREGWMNGFETTVISAVAALQNIVFWHRNLSRGKGFNINGFKSNHYPDFILLTQSGRIILLETKGDDRDNSDSQSKCRLGNKWAELAGEKFNYFMVFEAHQVEGAFNVNKAIALIKEL